MDKSARVMVILNATAGTAAATAGDEAIDVRLAKVFAAEGVDAQIVVGATAPNSRLTPSGRSMKAVPSSSPARRRHINLVASKSSEPRRGSASCLWAPSTTSRKTYTSPQS